MEKTAVCTVSSHSHVFKAKTLLSSARSNFSADLFCLITDRNETPEAAVGENYHTLDVLCSPLAAGIKNKYKGNQLRWSCKSLYIIYLLESGYEKVIYVDNDIFFFSSGDFLFDELEEAAILLTPHFYPISPDKDQNWLEANFRVGLYNAGFIAASKQAIPALEWWASCCLYNVKQAAWRGLFDDQKYLDLLPVIFDNVKLLKHKGCNLAGWNIARCGRETINDKLIIDGEWSLVFVHFTKLTFSNILSGKDNHLSGFMREYVDSLKIWKPDYCISLDMKRSYRDYLLYFRHIKWLFIRMFE